MRLHLNVKPGSKVNQLFYDAAGLLNVKIKAPAKDGKANVYLVKFLAKEFGIAQSSVTIVAGFANPHKRVEVDAEERLIKTVLKRLAM